MLIRKANKKTRGIFLLSNPNFIINFALILLIKTKHFYIIMKKIFSLLSAAMMLAACSNNPKQDSKVTVTEPILKEKFKNNFLIGTVLAADQAFGRDSLTINIAKKHFNALTAENCMKPEIIDKEKGKYDFSEGDLVVDFAKKNNMYMIGHVLIWHEQSPKWFWVDEQGNPLKPEVMKQNMKEFITATVEHYKGKVDAWDVVNETFNDDGTLRETPYYKILGEEYLKLAFQYAHEADPNAKLIFNDYNVSKPEKCDAIIKKINELKSQGCQIDYVGMQMHSTMTFPTIEQLETSLKKFEDNGIKVQITEFDLTAIPFPEGNTADITAKADYKDTYDPYRNGLTDSARNALNNRFNDIFECFVRHSANIERVTVWGITDKGSWRQDWPIKGRTDFPTLFYSDGKMKEFLCK
jgi:endo-1,4-beta-xylanase